MVNFERSMRLPVRMCEFPDDDVNYGSIEIIDQNNLCVGIVTAEEKEFRDDQNILDTRKDAVFITNAVNNFDNMIKLIKNYEKLLLKNKSKSKDINKIKTLLKSFKNIDYDNGIPYNWNEIELN